MDKEPKKQTAKVDSNPHYQKGGVASLIKKIDFARPCYVILAKKPYATCLIDPETGQPWHTYHRQQADNMLRVLEREDKVLAEVVTFIDALKYLCHLEGLSLKPPYTMENVSNQLIDAAIRTKNN